MSASEVAMPIVIDAGSSLVKAGLAGDDAPSSVFPTVIGESETATQDVEANVRYVGKEAIAKHESLSLRHPLLSGTIVIWDDMETVWHHIFQNELKVDAGQHPIMLTEPPQTAKESKERTLQILFERFNTPSAYIQMSSVLSLHASGRTTGLVVESGRSLTYSVPIYEGHAIDKGILSTNSGGNFITEALRNMLRKHGAYFTTQADFRIVQDIKEKLCYCAMNCQEEGSKANEEYTAQYKLPDNKILTVGKDRFMAAEVMFNRAEILGTVISESLPSLITTSIVNSDVDLRKTLATNIVLSGGNTMLTKLPERLETELQSMVSYAIRVTAPPERMFSPWIGGSMLASLSSFADIAVSKSEYDEEGATVMHKKWI